MDPAFPFFNTTDTALKQAYSYGDPRGGSYPDLPSPSGHQDDDDHQPPYAVHPASEIEFGEAGEPAESDVEFTPEYEPAFNSSREEQAQLYLDGSDYLSSGADDDATPSHAPPRRAGARAPAAALPPASGRGRGRQRGRGRGGRAGGGVGARKRKRAASVDDDALVRPRRKRAPAEPELSDEFKRLNSIVTNAWMNENYDEALQYGLEAIQLNPDYFPLHGTIAEILTKKGRPQDAVGALFAGVHSSREAENWWYVVDRLHELGGDTTATRSKLLYCYSTLISLNPKDYQARLGRLGCYRDKGLLKRALNECRFLLRLEPNDVNVLDQLSELSAVLDDHDALVEHFDAFLDKCMQEDMPETTNLTWTHLASYADAVIQTGEAKDGIKKVIAAARWLLGREQEAYWDAFNDDREWDPEPEPRRLEADEFTLGRFDESSYGLGLPIDIRIKLGVLRVLEGNGIEVGMVSNMYTSTSTNWCRAIWNTSFPKATFHTSKSMPISSKRLATCFERRDITPKP
jgi:general transcription factor 3C polypeptide 3 (transcription factor C subunit 4)